MMSDNDAHRDENTIDVETHALSIFGDHVLCVDKIPNNPDEHAGKNGVHVLKGDEFEEAFTVNECASVGIQ